MSSNPDETIIETQETMTGALLVNEGFIRQTDVETALEIQLQETAHTTGRPKTHPRTIGEILCDLNLIRPIDLNTVLKKYSKNLKLEQILIKLGSTDENTLTTVLRTAKPHSEPIGNLLLRRGIITETQLYEAYSLQYNLPYKPHDRFTLAPEERAALSRIVGKEFAQRFGLLPVALGRNHLGVAISDPENLRVIEALRTKQTDLRIECTLVTGNTFNRLFKLLYEKPPSKPRSDPANPAQYRGPTTDGSPAQSRRAERPSPSANQIVQFILNKAIQSKAGTIHLHRDETGATLKFPVHGKSHSAPPLWFEKRFREIAGEVIHRVKEMAGLNQDNKRRPEEGFIQTTYQDPLSAMAIPVTFSVVTRPTPEGEDIILSHLPKEQQIIVPEAPALDETSIETLRENIPIAGITACKSKHRREEPITSETSVYTELISDPEAQREAVVRLHAAYERLAIAQGLRSGPSDPRIFGRFIQHHFHQICKKYQCHQVSFNVLDRQPQLIITAIPVLPAG